MSGFHVKCFETTCEELVSAIDVLKIDCKSNPDKFVLHDDIAIGLPWLKEDGPNYVAYDCNNTPVGFLAVGWKFSKDLMEKEYPASSFLENSFGTGVELGPTIGRPQFELQENYNLFLFISSKHRRMGVGQTLLSNIPDLLEKYNYQLRYSSVPDNYASISLLEKMLPNLPSSVVVDKYSTFLESENTDLVSFVISLSNAEDN